MRTTPRRLLAIAATTAACVAAPGVATASSDPVCNQDGRVRPDFMSVREAVWKPVGAADWRPFPTAVHICDYDASSGPITAFNVQLAMATGDALDDHMPAGSRFRLTMRTTDARDPVQRVSGLVGNPDVTFRGRDLVVEGDVASVRLPHVWNGDEPVCSSPARATVSLTLQSNWAFAAGTVAYRQQGLMMGTNAAREGGLTVSSAGIFFSIAGCGDGDPSTREGFADGFIPGDLLVDLGLPAGTLESAPPEAIDGFLQMFKDTTVDGSAVFTRATRGGVLGVAFQFRTSYSKHDVDVRLDAQNIKAIRKCSLAGASVGYSNAGDRTVVTCAAPLRLVTRGTWKLTGKKKSRLRIASLVFTTTPDAVYRVKATRGRVERAGTCKAKSTRGTCTVRLIGRGKWTVSVTSIKEGIEGDVVTRRYRT